jgi:hypothetical protein
MRRKFPTITRKVTLQFNIISFRLDHDIVQYLGHIMFARCITILKKVFIL